MRGTRPFGGAVTPLALAVGLLCPDGASAKVGLAARFGDVILEGAKPGRTYNLREAARVPFGVENRSDVEQEVLVEFERPRPATLSPGYEAASDLSWFKAVPERIKVAPRSLGFFDLLMTVPDDPGLAGKHLQVAVKVRTAPGSGGMVGVAIENRLRVSIGPGPEAIKEEKKRKAMQQLDFDVSPQSLYLVGVPLGRPWDARKEARKSIRVANFAADPLTVTLKAEGWDSRVPLPQGYEPIPEPGWLTVRPSTVPVGPEEIASAGVVADIPDKPEHRGRRWAAVVRTGLATGFWLDAPVKVFVETEP